MSDDTTLTANDVEMRRIANIPVRQADRAWELNATDPAARLLAAADALIIGLPFSPLSLDLAEASETP